MFQRLTIITITKLTWFPQICFLSIPIISSPSPAQNSLEVLDGALVERSVSGAPALTKYQFERVGYFCVDIDSTKDTVSQLLHYN